MGPKLITLSYMGSQLVNDIGTWISRIAIMAYVFQSTHSGLAVAGVLMADSIPRTLMSIPLSKIASKIGLRKACQMSAAGEAMLLILLIGISKHLLFVYIVLSFKSVLDALYTVSSLTLFPLLIHSKEQLMKANFRLHSVTAGIAAVGPAIGGVIFELAGLQVALGVDALSFCLTCFGFSLIKGHITGNTTARDSSSLRALKSLWHNGDKKSVMLSLSNGVAIIGGGLYNTAIPVFLQLNLGLNPWKFGLAMGSFGFGAFGTSSIFSSFYKRQNPRSIFTLALIGSVVTLAILVFVHNFIIACIVLFCLGGLSAMRGTSARTNIQVISDDSERGLVIGFYQAIVNLALLLGMVFGGVLIGVLTAKYTLLVALLFYLVAISMFRLGFNLDFRQQI